MTNRRKVCGNDHTLPFRKTIVDLYELFPDKDKINKQTFRSVLVSFNYILVKSTIDTGSMFQLPLGLGLFYIARKKHKSKRYNLDFPYYKETGIRREFPNKHSQGYMASFKWYKKKPFFTVKVPARAYYTPLRAFKRYLAKCIKEHNTIDKYTIYD